jgi:hypothetical protein
MKTKPLDVLKKIGVIILSIIICLVLVSIVGLVHDKIFPPTATPTRVPTPTTPVRQKGSIHDFLASKKVHIEMKGAGIDEVEMLISKLVEEALEVEIPVGTMFISESESLQRMVVRKAEVIYLDTNVEISVEIDVACADYWKDVPHSLDTFATVLPPPEDDVTRLMRYLEDTKDLDFEYTFYSVVQAAVWIITSDSTYSGLGRLVVSSTNFGVRSPSTRMIDEEAAARAMFLVHNAGIDITTKKIWQDREEIIKGLEDQKLIEWIRSLD